MRQTQRLSPGGSVGLCAQAPSAGVLVGICGVSFGVFVFLWVVCL